MAEKVLSSFSFCFFGRVELLFPTQEFRRLSCGHFPACSIIYGVQFFRSRSFPYSSKALVAIRSALSATTNAIRTCTKPHPLTYKLRDATPSLNRTASRLSTIVVIGAQSRMMMTSASIRPRSTSPLKDPASALRMARLFQRSKSRVMRMEVKNIATWHPQR